MVPATVEVDGSMLSGSGSVVRQAVAYSAVSGRPVHLFNIRARRPRPGLRRQHLAVTEAVRDLVGGTLTGVAVGSRELVFVPGRSRPGGAYSWDIGSAGSATALALAVMAVLAGWGAVADAEVRGGLFQDGAPCPLHLQGVLTPLLRAMGLSMELEIVRPGYPPAGEGVLRFRARPQGDRVRPLVLERRGDLQRVTGVALASHLQDRRVTERMSDAASQVLAGREIRGLIEERNDTTAAQAGAAFALMAEFEGGARLGADRAGAPHRSAERIGRGVAHRLLEEVDSGATVDRFALDQLLPFMAMADGTSRCFAHGVTEHVETGAWLASIFLGAEVRTSGGTVEVLGRR